MLMAQKTPIPALLMGSAESWNSLYFQDLKDLQGQLVEDYLLRFLFYCFVRKNRNWVQRFSVKKTGGKYFIKVSWITAKQTRSFLPVTLPQKIFRTNLIKRKNKFAFYWRKIIPLFFKKALMTKHGATKTNLVQLVPTRFNTRRPLFNRQRLWISNLEKRVRKNIRWFKKRSRLLRNFKKYQKRFFSYNILKHVNSVYFLETQKPFNNLVNFKSENYRSNLNTTYTMSHSSLFVQPYKLIPFVLKWILKFFRKRTKNWNVALRKWFKRWGHKLRFKKNMARRLHLIQNYWIASQRLTKTVCSLYCRAEGWKKAHYKPVSRFVMFERYRSQPYITQVLAATHFAVSRGVPVVLTDFMRMYLMELQNHRTFLKSVHTALRYFLSFQGFLMIEPSSFCQGAKVVVSGKINGSARKKTLSFMIGAIPTGSLSSHISYDSTSVMTRYGSLHVHIWLSYKHYDTWYREQIWQAKVEAHRQKHWTKFKTGKRKSAFKFKVKRN